jgi:hypothetical protein
MISKEALPQLVAMVLRQLFDVLNSSTAASPAADRSN